MTPDELKAQAVEWIDRGMNEKDLDFVLSRISDDVVDHQLPPGMPPGKDSAKAVFGMMFSAVPDMEATVQDAVASGDRVTLRTRMSGTQTGEMFGMPATGKPFSIEAIDTMRFDADGIVVEHWGILDVMGMMMQTGMVPPPPPPG